jgi:hypothetical protein
MAATPELASDFTSLALTALQWAMPALLLWIVIKITDQSIKGTITDIFHEFVSILSAPMNPRAINALGGILLFVLTIFLFFGGLAHIAMPSPKDAHGSDVTRGIYLAVVFLFGLYFIICLQVTKRNRR